MTEPLYRTRILTTPTESFFGTVGDDFTATGRIKKVVHLSQQTYLPNTRLVPDHNDKGYGMIEAEDGRDVYFPHELVEGRRGFDDLRRDQVVEYTLENGPYLRANFVRLLRAAPGKVHRPAA